MKPKATDETGSKPRWYSGRFTLRWEVSSFEPDGTRERWWVSFERADEKARKRLVESSAAGIEVRLRGAVSKPGSYGHLGQYDREFTVEKIGEMAKPAPVKENK